MRRPAQRADKVCPQAPGRPRGEGRRPLPVPQAAAAADWRAPDPAGSRPETGEPHLASDGGRGAGAGPDEKWSVKGEEPQVLVASEGSVPVAGGATPAKAAPIPLAPGVLWADFLSKGLSAGKARSCARAPALPAPPAPAPRLRRPPAGGSPPQCCGPLKWSSSLHVQRRPALSSTAGQPATPPGRLTASTAVHSCTTGGALGTRQRATASASDRQQPTIPFHDRRHSGGAAAHSTHARSAPPPPPPPVSSHAPLTACQRSPLSPLSPLRP